MLPFASPSAPLFVAESLKQRSAIGNLILLYKVQIIIPMSNYFKPDIFSAPLPTPFEIFIFF
jgi:hypothetical protein